MKRIFNIVVLLMGMLVFVACSSKRDYSSYDEYPAYFGDDLELVYSPKKSQFRLWSPAAEQVRLNLYEDGVNGAPYATYEMKQSKNGTWEYSVHDDLLGKFYTFQVKIDGRFLRPTPGIWAKAVGCNGDRGAIIDMSLTNPEGWKDDIRPEMKSFTDAIIYELHYRDFTISPTANSQYAGKFLGVIEQGVKTDDSLPAALDHLKELGITHVQIQPSYDFGSIDETRLEDNVYNWGYDPKNFNVPEGSYSTDPYDPYCRIREFKQMVAGLHKAGIRVIMDVVYNHTYVGETSQLNLTAPGYFYRLGENGEFLNGSGCGNETASERAMMRHYMVESVKYWVNEYHVDGFRFDLMGIHDIETMNAIRAALDEIDPTISIHGEGWAAGDCGIAESERAVKLNAQQIAPIAVFSDDIRDALRGNWIDGNKGGFLNGQGFEPSIKFGVVGATEHKQVNAQKVVHADKFYATSAAQTINYVSCHDDPCLVDKLRAIDPQITEAQLIRLDLMAQTMVLTSQGVPFIFCGEEMLRNKKGVHNSYNSPDDINMIDWHNKQTYNAVFEYYKNLIALRKAHPAFRMSDQKMIEKAIKFKSVPASVVAYTIDGTLTGDEWSEIYVAYNANLEPVQINLPAGQWRAVCYDGKINLNGITTFVEQVNIPYSSVLILYKK